MKPPRQELIKLVQARFPGATVTPLTGDASTRRFFRMRRGETWSRVLMDYGRPFSGETDDIRLARLFREAGLPVAEVLLSCASVGCLVLEDLGDLTLEAAMNDAARSAAGRRELLKQAVSLAARVAESGTPVLARSDRATGPELDPDRFRFEMDYFLQHFVGGLHHLTHPPATLRRQLYGLADLAAETPARVFCHRDFHSRNLMLRPDGRLAMVDLQDARWGPDSYDLASLLRDAYLEVDENWVDPLVERYRAGLGTRAAGFRERFDIVSAQRMIKALGTFGYQVGQRRADRYRESIPRTIDRLKRLLPRLDATAKLHEALVDNGLLDSPQA